MVHWKGGPSFSSDEVKYNDEVLYAPDCIEKEGKYYLAFMTEGLSSQTPPVASLRTTQLRTFFIFAT